LVSIHSSPNDQMLWAIDSKWNVHVRVGITEEMPVGTDWEHVPGKTKLKHKFPVLSAVSHCDFFFPCCVLSLVTLCKSDMFLSNQVCLFIETSVKCLIRIVF